MPFVHIYMGGGNWVSSRPFWNTGHKNPWTFESSIHFNEDTKLFSFPHSKLWNEDRGEFDIIKLDAILPPPNFLRYHTGPIHSRTYNIRDFDAIEVGKNWQTLSFVRDISQFMGIEFPENYEELTDTHFALAILRNKIHYHFGHASGFVVRNPAHSPVAMGLADADSVTPFQRGPNELMIPISFGFSPDDTLWNFTNRIADFVKYRMIAESFFSADNIINVVNSAAALVGGDVDKEFLINAMTEFGKDQLERFDRQLAESFENAAFEKARWVYNYYMPGYDIEGSANFEQFKQSFIELLEDMFAEAVDILLFGNRNQSVDNLLDNVWESDRLFNIGGKFFKMRDLSGEQPELPSGQDNEVSDEDDDESHAVRLSLRERLTSMFLERFAVKQNIAAMLAEYDKFLI